ncbi:MAG: phosphate transporter [Gammaproteobacteria bacterium]|nr:MAG: phosphate transporter [Gammaproteobacteria bacterium]TND05281.1 MAG: phosphate transporter [Gammaproteobacteria bacterium]
MMSMIAVFVLVLLLAWANGANDIAKGVATLVGNGTASARRAILWGTLWTLLGGLTAIVWGTALMKTFSSGYLSADFHVDVIFLAATLGGAALWVFAATRLGLPVSTTHALLGGVVGATLVAAGPSALHAGAVTQKALLPLLLSPLIAIGLCASLLLVTRYVAKRVPAWTPGCCDEPEWRRNPYACAPQRKTPGQLSRPERIWSTLHWLSSGATSFARGLNDVPKIAAFLVLALALYPNVSDVSTPLNSAWPVIAVAVTMAGGSLWGGLRILNVMAHRVTPLDASSGLVANVGTSALVLLASPLGLPVSTTHVSAGSLMGIRWTQKARPNHADALKMILFGWVVTLPVAAAIAALASWSLNHI